MRLHAIAGGRLRILWMSRREQIKLWGCAFALVALFGLVGRWDYEDQVASAQAAEERARVSESEARKELDEIRAAKKLPKTTFIIEATTPEAAALKLAEIAGDLDAERMRINGR